MPRKKKELRPTEIRELLKEGRYMFENRHIPQPPEEWPPWKRGALNQCIESAWLFLRGKDYGEIRKAMGMPDITRQRVSQRVIRGTKFMIQRGWLRPRQ